MAIQTTYQFLKLRPGSTFLQRFVKGCKLRAEILYRATVGLEPRTPEEVSDDFGVPLEAVREAVHYCRHNEALLQQERENVLSALRARGIDKPSCPPVDTPTGA
jgi:hypothetical protein